MACLTALLREVRRSCKAATVSAIICSPGQGLELFVAALMHASSWDRLMPHPAHAPLWPSPEMRTRHFSPSDAHFMLMQSSCPTPVGTPQRAMLQGDQLQVSVPSTDISPQTVFGSLDPKSLAALQAAFHDSFAGERQEFKVRCACCLTCARCTSKLSVMGEPVAMHWLDLWLQPASALPSSAGISSGLMCKANRFLVEDPASVLACCMQPAHFDVMVLRPCVLCRSLLAVTARLCLLQLRVMRGWWLGSPRSQLLSLHRSPRRCRRVTAAPR